MRTRNLATTQAKVLAAGLAAALAAALTLAGCGHGETQKAEAAANPNPSLISIPADQLSGLQIVTVGFTTIKRSLRLPGSVSYNLFETTPVISQIGGPAGRILVAPGQHVHAGEILLYVNSPDYAQARSNYLKAKDAFQLADRNYQRTKDLYEHQAAAERDLEQAESDRAQAEADLQASKQSLAVLGIRNERQLLQSSGVPAIPVLAPISGEIVDRTVAPGQVLQGGSTQVFTISNMHTVWVMANVFEDDLSHVHTGDPADITSDAYPNRHFRGRVSYVGAALDPNSRTVQARIVTDNPDEMLKNNMYVTASLSAGTISKVIAVPDAAVLRDSENLPFVYVELGKDRFSRRSIQVGQSNAGLTEVASGLSPGDKIVGNGSLFLQFETSYQQ
jgi:cobalt-zinc-cadmium efflux system membrane fusion protein